MTPPISFPRRSWIAAVLTTVLALTGCAGTSAAASTDSRTKAAPVAAIPAPPATETGTADSDSDSADEDSADIVEREQTPVPDAESPVQPEGHETSERRCEIEYLGEDLTGNRSNMLATGRMQVVLFYDGDPDSSPELRIGIGEDDEVMIGGDRAGGGIETFGRSIETREYQLYDCAPNGSFTVSGVVPNGVIDGLAFALLWRDDRGRFTMIKSNTVSSAGATYVGMWPLGFSRDSFTERTPQVSTSVGRETARGLVTGSALMPNGSYQLGLPTAN